MKEKWFLDWLKDNGYVFWYEERDNEIWINTQYTIVWHPALGIRLQITNEMASEEYISATLIKQEA